MLNEWKIEIIGIPKGSPVNIYLQCDGQGAAERHTELVTLINDTRNDIMAQIDEVLQNLDDMEALVEKIVDVITKGDQLAIELRKQIADLIAAANISAQEKAALAAKIDAAFAKSVATEDKLRAVVPLVPPVGGDPLKPSYASNAEFLAAVAAYKGPEAVTSDGDEIKAGTSPAIAYFSHSADGSVSTSGPTD